jgi:hypothetical protein
MVSYQNYGMQSAAFGDPNPMSWAVLQEMPFQDRYAGGEWVCGANTSWGTLKSDVPPDSHYCTSCPPCKVDRFQTRLMVRDAGPPCCTTESYEYNTGAWPYQFAGGSVCPNGPDLPLFQDLYAIKKRPQYQMPVEPIYDPYVL